MTNQRTGERSDYTRAEGLIYSGIYAPKGSPEWANDREQLWNHAEAAEKRKDATTARNYIIALPHELTNEQRRWTVEDFIKENFTRKGYAADLNIHAPDKDGDQRNYHAHILVTDRQLTPDGFAPTKKERHGMGNNKATLLLEKESWARIANRHLERHGFEGNLDHRSLEAQGIDREPTKHLGPLATEIERDNRESYTGNENRATEERNFELKILNLEGGKIALEIHQLERELLPDSNRQDRHDEAMRTREDESEFKQYGSHILERGFNEDREADTEEKIYQPDYSGEAPPSDRPDERADIANDNSVNWTAYEGEVREAANLEAADLDSAANGASKGVGGAFSIFAKVAEKALETLTGTIENAIGGYTPRTKEDILDMRDRAADLKAWKNQEAERIDTQQREQIAANNNQETITRETMEKESSERARDYGDRER